MGYDEISSVAIEDAGGEATDGCEFGIAVPIFDGVVSIVLYNFYKGIFCLFAEAEEVAEVEGRCHACNFGEMVQS